MKLQDAWRDVVETRRRERSAEIERRKAAGIPLDDGDGPLEEFEAFVPDERLEGVTVRFRTVTPEVYAETTGEVQQFFDRVRSIPVDQAKALRVASVELGRAQAEFVRHAVAYIDGMQLEEDGELVAISASADEDELLDVDVVSMLRSAGVVGALYATARDFQSLDPLARRRFGCAAPSTSAPLSAAIVATGNGSSAAATEAPEPSSSKASPSSRIRVLDVSGSDIERLETRSASIT